jgi:hypothetical protein
LILSSLVGTLSSSYQHSRPAQTHSDDQESSTLYPRSDKVFTQLNTWLHECVTNHGECNIKYDPHFTPTRLIDVGRSGTSPRLVLTRVSRGDYAKYLTLSHRWGSSMPEAATTKTTTLTTRLSKLPIRSLPRTFQHAIIATRKLKFQYLWIDSLCIVQDSPADWQQESALMGKVYSHCFCMLAAAASLDCTGGLFPLRSELPILPAIDLDGGSTSRLVLLKRAYRGSGGKIFSKAAS